jgi:hypothetical protein
VGLAIRLPTWRNRLRPERRLLSYVPDSRAAAARWKRRVSWVAMIVAAFFYGIFYAFLPSSFIPPLAVPLLVLAAAVIWALPNKDWIPMRTLRWLFAGVAIALIAWPNYLAIALPGLPWITLSRLVIFPLTALFLVSLSASPTLRQELKAVVGANRMAVRLLLLFVGLMFISIAFSKNPVDSFEKFVIDQIYWTAMFLIACCVFRDGSFIVRWSWVLTGLAVLVSVIAMWEWRLGRLPWVGHIPSFLHIDDNYVSMTLVGQYRPGSNIRRLQSTFGESLGLAQYLALTSPLFMHFAIQAPKFWMRALALALIPFIFFTIVMTGARLGMVGFLLAMLLYTGAWAFRRWQSDRQSILGPAIIVTYPALAFLAVAATFVSHRLHMMVWGGGNSQSSTDARIAQFNLGWPKVMTHPLGHGVNQGGGALGFTNPDGVLTIDSYALKLGLDYGPLGLVLFYTFFGLVILRCLPTALRPHKPETALLLPFSISLSVFLVLKSVYSSEAVHAIPFMITGCMCAVLARANADASATSLRTGVRANSRSVASGPAEALPA